MFFAHIGARFAQYFQLFYAIISIKLLHFNFKSIRNKLKNDRFSVDSGLVSR